MCNVGHWHGHIRWICASGENMLSRASPRSELAMRRKTLAEVVVVAGGWLHFAQVPRLPSIRKRLGNLTFACCSIPGCVYWYIGTRTVTPAGTTAGFRSLFRLAR